jgi:uncharacterized membrane protein YqjE
MSVDSGRTQPGSRGAPVPADRASTATEKAAAKATGKLATADAKTEPSVGELAKQASEHMSTLIRSEIELAKSEVGTQVKRAGLSVALFVVAGALAIYGLTFGFIALAEGLVALDLSRWLAYLIVFVFLLLVAGLLVFVGVRKIKTVGAPKRTIDSLKEDAELTKRFRPSS